jgi:hypothetical protein
MVNIINDFDFDLIIKDDLGALIQMKDELQVQQALNVSFRERTNERELI